MKSFRIPLLIATIVSFSVVSGVTAEKAIEHPSAVRANPPAIETFVAKTLQENRDLPPFAPESQASIVPAVAPASVASKKSIPCTGTQLTNFDCYEDFFKALTAEKGSPAAFALLRATYPTSDYVRSQCHPITHVIGREAAAGFSDVSEAFAHGDSFCWSGYYHGVMEKVIGKIGKKNLPQQVDGICAKLHAARPYSFDDYNCVHGLGHGVMAITNDELFESLKLCDNLTDQWNRSSCWSGAFMENVIVDGKNHFTKYLRPSDPLYPCNAADEQYKQTCYLMQTSYMLKVMNGDFRKVFDLCEKADAGHTETCYQSLGRDASGRSVSNVAQTKATCLLGKDYTQQSNCVIGAVKDFISYLHDDVRAKELCAALPDNLREVCTSTAENYYKLF